MFKTFLTIAIVCLVFVGPAWSHTAAKINAVRTSAPPTIDGDLGDATWKGLEAATGFVIFPGGKDKATKQTTAYITYDDKNLYVAYKCDEPTPDKAKAVVKARDGDPIWDDDEIELFLDPAHKAAKPYFQIIVNAGNVQFDNYTGAGDVGWNAKWESAVKVAAGSWGVEFSIPFAELKVGVPKDGDVWGINFTRHVMTVAPDQWTTWSVIEAGGFHQPQLFGDVTFKEPKGVDVEPAGKLATSWGKIKWER